MAFRLLSAGVDVPPRPRRWIRVVSAVVVAAAVAYAWGTTGADEDLWNHLRFGEEKLRTLAIPHVEASSYSAPGHPWFNHEWGAEVVFALCYRLGGAPALYGLKFALGLIVVAAMLAAARTLCRADDTEAAAHPAVTAAALVVGFAALAPGTSFRPQLFTMACLAVEWALCLRAEARLFARGARRRVGRELALVPLVVLVWTNAHGGFPVGVALAGTFVAGVLARATAARALGEEAPPAASLAVVAAAGVATVAATFVNPYGAALHRYLATTLADHGRITEWLPIPAWSPSHAPFKVLAVATFALAVPWVAARSAASARLDWRLAFLAAAAFAAFRHQRHSVLFAIVATPVLVAAADDARRRLVARAPWLVPRPPVAAAIAAGALAVAALQVGIVAARFAESGLSIRYARAEFPADAIAFLRSHGVRGNMAVQFEWGGYTLYHLGDAARVFLDGRYEAAYPARVMDDYFAFVEGAPGWDRVLDAYPTELVLLERDAPVVARLDARPDLVRIYADATAVAYAKRDGAWAHLAVPDALARRAPDAAPAVAFP